MTLRIRASCPATGSSVAVWCWGSRALSPGLSIQYSSAEDRRALVAKFRGFIELGTRFLSLMLDDGRTIRINVPAHLPFQLAEAAVPDVLVLGSSRPREAIRPDVLAAELPGVQRVINASVSAAVMRTMELILDRFSRVIGDRKVEILIIAVDNFSFTAFASRRVFVRRSSCTTRSPTTH